MYRVSDYSSKIIRKRTVNTEGTAKKACIHMETYITHHLNAACASALGLGLCN